MPEIRPTLNKISAFDAAKGSTVTFSWTGPQAQKNRLVIKEYDSPNRIVYDCTQKTMALKHTLHLTEAGEENISQNVPYGLENGKRYLATVYIYDIYNQESLPSREAAFYCFGTPFFSFVNFTSIGADNIARVSTNSIYLNVRYAQNDGETLQEYRFRLFDHQGRELLSSRTFYGSTADDTLQWTLGGVTDTDKTTNGELNYANAYKIVCEAVTAHGMALSTAQNFVVQKDTGGVGALLTLESLPDNTISISSHFKITNAILNGEEVYLYDKENQPYAIDLTENRSLSYFDGFVVKEPWEISAVAGKCQPGSVLLRCTNNQGEEFSLSYHVRRYPSVEKAYFLLEATRQTTRFLLRSDYLPVSDQWYVLYLSYENGYYTLKVNEKGGVPGYDHGI